MEIPDHFVVKEVFFTESSNRLSREMTLSFPRPMHSRVMVSDRIQDIIPPKMAGFQACTLVLHTGCIRAKGSACYRVFVIELF
jgi:hypothetical protein